jgi:hypothetical protein
VAGRWRAGSAVAGEGAVGAGARRQWVGSGQAVGGDRPRRGRRAGRASSADLWKATAVAGAGRAGWPERRVGRRRFPNGGGWLAR